MLLTCPLPAPCGRQRNPELRSVRAKRDERLVPHIERVWQANFQVYGADKVWKQMNHESTAIENA